MKHFPDTGFVRLPQILGNPKTKPPTAAVIPISRAAWWNGIKKGRFPRPIKLGPRTTAWRVEDILKLIEEINATQGGEKS